jgi:hypothetical protein
MKTIKAAVMGLSSAVQVLYTIAEPANLTDSVAEINAVQPERLTR